MDKFSKILVSAAAASVLASGAMASGLQFYYTINDTDDNRTNVEPYLGSQNTQILNDYNISNREANSPATLDATIMIDDLLKGAPNLRVNAYNTVGWPGANTFNHSVLLGVLNGNEHNHRILSYYSDSELPKDATLTFKVSCGMLQKIAPQDVYLYALDSDANGSSAWIRVGHLTDFTTATQDGLTGYTMLKFAVDSNYEVANDSDNGVTNGGGVDHNFTMFNGLKETTDDQQGNIPAGTLLVFATERNTTAGILSDRGTEYVNHDTNLTSLFIVPKKGDSCGCVCDTVLSLTDARDKTGTKLSAPMSNVKPVTLISYTPGLRAVVVTQRGAGVNNFLVRPADSWIDLRPASKRKRFLPSNMEPNGNNDVDTTPLTSTFRILLDQNNAHYSFDLNSQQDTFKLNVNRAIDCAVKRVDVTSWNNGSAQALKDPNGGGYNLTNSFNTVDLTDANVTFTVNGQDVICPGMWRVSLEVSPATPGVSSKKVLNVANADDWRMTAMEFIVPYLNTDPNYGTYIVITNQGDQTANVFFDAFGDGGKNAGTPTSAYYTNVPLGDIPKRSTRIYFPKDMNSALKARFPAWNANRYMAHFYVATANPNIRLIEDSIEAAAFQKDGNNGKRSIPILTRGRVWNGNQITGHTFHE